MRWEEELHYFPALRNGAEDNFFGPLVAADPVDRSISLPPRPPTAGPARVEIELQGDTIRELLRPIAAAILKGILGGFLEDSVNYVNAPMLAER